MKRVRINLLAALVILFGTASLASAAPAAPRAPFGECEDLDELAEDVLEICGGAGGTVIIICTPRDDGPPELKISVKCN